MRVPISKRLSDAALAVLLIAAFVAQAGAAYGQQTGKAADALAEAFSDPADATPVILRHLPDWEAVRERAVYAPDSQTLRQAVSAQPVLEVVPFAGGTEAATADYGAAGRLAIVEFSTPQIASDADAAVKSRIEELRAAGRSVPSVYRRVGNYSVFVFGAADAQAAEELAGRVKYEKDVRWLGEDPHRFEKHNRYWINMSASVIVNTVKATGLAIVMCLGVGGVFGTIIFRRRRAQAALAETYSDAGGMMRLNLDDDGSNLAGQAQK